MLTSIRMSSDVGCIQEQNTNAQTYKKILIMEKKNIFFTLLQ